MRYFACRNIKFEKNVLYQRRIIMVTMMKYLRIWAAVTIAFLVCVGGAENAMASEEITEEQLRRHVEELFLEPPKFVGKWNEEIRYRISGTNNERVQLAAKEVMDYFSSLSGISVKNAGGGEANFVLVLTSSIGESAKFPEIELLFRSLDETIDVFHRRMENADRSNNSFRKINYTEEDNISSFYIIDNPHKKNKIPLRNYFFHTLKDGFVNAYRSNEIEPSIYNRNYPNSGFFAFDVNHLPAVDEAFFKAIYSSSIQSNSPRKSAQFDIIRQVLTEIRRKER